MTRLRHNILNKYDRIFMNTFKSTLSILLLMSNLALAEEYEIVGVRGTVPFKINEKGNSISQSQEFIDPSGGTVPIITNTPGLTYIQDITDTDSIVGSYYGRLSIVFGNFHPLRGEGFIDYPTTGSDELFDAPIFAFDKNNSTGKCYNGTAGTVFSTAACGYINGEFKLFTLSLDQSSLSNKEYLFRMSQSANAMNSSGVVVGEAIINFDSNSNATDKNLLRAFSWTQAGGAVDLGTLGGSTSAALDINETGTIVGRAAKSINGTDRIYAFTKITNGSMTGINLGDFQLESVANAINDAGTVVGTVKRQDARGEYTEAFIKSNSSNDGVELRTLTHPAFKQVTLISATDINNHGEVVGETGSNRGYIARPLPTTLKPFPFTGGRSARATADYLIWRPNTGTWYALRPSLEGSTNTISYSETLVKQWGLPGDLPIFGADFDGDKIDDLTVWRPSNGTWYTCLSSKEFDCTQGTASQFGLPGDIPLVADFDKDGKSDLVVYRRSLPAAGIIGRWYVKKSSNNEIISQQWGLAEDYPLQGDFNGDGYSDFAVFRPSIASWFVLYSNQVSIPQTFVFKQFGLPGDHPVPRDIDADGATDLLVYRTASATWFSCVSSKEFACFKSDGSLNNPKYSYGLPTDYPIYRNVIGGETVPYAVWRPIDTVYRNEGGWYTNIPSDTIEVSLKHWGLKSDIPAGVGIRDLLILTGQENKAR